MCDVLKKSSKKEIWNWQMQQTLEIAKPMVSRKFAKKLYKLIGVAFEAKAVSKGVKDVQKSIRKKKQGIVIIAGDSFPMDSVAHLPVYCEDYELTYCFTPSMEDLGASHDSTKECLALMIQKIEGAEYSDLYEYCLEKIKKLHSE